MRFRYLKDPLFVFCVLLYFMNRWLLKPHFSIVFLHDYLNDDICIPFWVPIMLFIMRKLRLRGDDLPPGGCELLIPLLLWSWGFEMYLPATETFRGLAISDYRDILCYASGALFAGVFWKLWYSRSARDLKQF